MSLRRSIWLLMALVVVQLFFLTTRASEESERPSLLHRVAVGAVSPFAVVVDGTGDMVTRIGEGLADRSRVMAENEQLREENERMRRQLVQQRAELLDLGRLRDALDYRRAWGGDVRPVDVVYIDHASWLQSALLAVGEGGAERDQAVVSGEGLLGRVILVAGSYAKVQLVTDRTAQVGVMVERTRRQGITRGAGRGGLRLEFLPERSDLVVGDRLVTAGIDGIYPRGIPVGTVRSIEPGPDLFYRVEVDPAVDFSRLDQALLLPPAAVPEAVIDATPGSPEDPS